MAISKIILNGVTQMDVTGVSVQASNLIAPNTAIGADGEAVVGTASGGGSSSWTKIAETSYQVSTTSTSTVTVATWETGHSELWTDSKWVYVRIRDTAGKRADYFYGSDNFFTLVPGLTSATTIHFISMVNTNGVYGINTGSYGVWADTLYSDGRIRIRVKYNSSSSRTINGTYKVEVYLLDPPTGAPIFT